LILNVPVAEEGYSRMRCDH